MKKISHIIILSDTQYIPLATSYLAALGEIIGFSKQDSFKMSIALEEALVTTMKNAFPTDKNKEIEIIFEVDQLNLTISIKNKGLPYILEAVNFNLLEMGDGDDDALGIHMMQSLMDGFAHHSLGMEGQEIRLVKYLEKSIDFEAVTDTYVAEDVEQYTFDFRPAKKEELIQISRCMYDEFGYSYANDSFYYIERLATLIDEGKLYPFVSVTNQGEVAAHTALSSVPEFPKLMETAAWVVKQRFRKNSLMKTLLPFQLKKSEELGINGVIVDCVTHHPATQKVVEKYGFTPLAFYFHRTPEDVVTSFEVPKGFRNSVALGVKYYKTPEHVKIYAPAVHKDFILQRYASINTTPQWLESDFAPIEPFTLMASEYSTRRQFGTIQITTTGVDLDRALKSQIARLRSQKAESAALFVNMEREDCPYIFEYALKNNFVFSGVIPNTGSGEVMIMNHLMGKPIRYDWIKAIGTYEEILNYIKEHDQTVL